MWSIFFLSESSFFEDSAKNHCYNIICLRVYLNFIIIEFTHKSCDIYTNQFVLVSPYKYFHGICVQFCM